jgi:hypothetical protein
VEVLTAAEFAKKKQKKSTVKAKDERGRKPEKLSSPDSDIKEEGRIFVLQDPDLKTYKDQIEIKGRMIERVCKNGLLKTSDKDLKDFLIGKKYILIETKETNDGKENIWSGSKQERHEFRFG